MKQPRRLRWTPYLLLMPSLVFLAIFFAWPMFRSLTLVFQNENAILTVRAEPASDEGVGQLPQSLQVSVLQARAMPFQPIEERDEPEVWLRVSGLDAAGQRVEGWAGERRVRVPDPAAPERAVVVRRDLDLLEEPQPLSAAVGTVAVDEEVEIIDRAEVTIWYEISGAIAGEEPITGWVDSRYVDILTRDEASVTGLIRSGDASEWTLQWVQRMTSDRNFMPALTTTVLLIVLILPIQFVLAIIMALVLQQRLRGNTLFLYIFAIPLGVSDLAVGIVWYSVFTQSGYLNSFLYGLGLIQSPPVYLSVDSTHWMIIAIVLAEVWRATSLVMVIVVSGLQAIPLEVLEAAELFGAGLWQRVRYVILPLLKPSLQVALILRTILAFQVFGVVIAIAGRGLTVLANESYRWYVELRNPHVAGAYAGLILLISMVTAIFYLRAVRTQEEAME